MEKELKRKARNLLKKIPKSKWVSYNSYPTGEPGTPDVIGTVSGRSVLIEFKVIGREPSPIQRVRRKEWKDAGALVFVVHSVEDLKLKLKENKIYE